MRKLYFIIPVLLFFLGGCVAGAVVGGNIYIAEPPVYQIQASRVPLPRTEAPPPAEPLPESGIEREITLRVLGPNMVYAGEGFRYTCEVSGDTAKAPEISWRISGNAACIDSGSGELTGVEKGTVTITASDAVSGLCASLDVHIVETSADVDFVPTVNGIPIVNKTYPLPHDYAPGDLQQEAKDAYDELVRGAAADGITISFISGFRSYGYQKQVHDNWVNTYGAETADTLSARAGFSEHQLGCSIDVNSLLSDFAYTEEGIWLKENCWKYGFIIRYPAGKESITGYIYEPWHIRWLGNELAEKVTKSGLCLEEYLGVDSYYREEPGYDEPVTEENDTEEAIEEIFTEEAELLDEFPAE